ncbi:MAG TPA: OmpA family protein [Steroidobacteraceae bacterium]|jgi:outer membrane protein OmpA-like peptidoglycan-associated protein|nr:OmpA family protein [Steroidobacteraceae bacterium]
MSMQRMACVAFTLLGVTVLDGAAFAGDRDGVSEELEGIAATWPDALFSIDVHGTDDGNAALNQRLEIVYEAASPGYLAYLRVSSHGDVTLYRDLAKAGRTSGTQPYLIKPPLGSEQLIVLFANKPWDALFAKGATTRELGGERTDAATLVKQLAQLHDSDLLFAARRYQLQIAASPGGTEYTTRAIVRRVKEGGGGSGTRIPSRIQFEFNSDQLTPQGKLDLDTFGEALITDLRNSGVALEGHTDAIGADDYNMDLSERRAAAAKQYLIDSFGIAASRLSTVGMGKDNPIASNGDEAGRSKNRRVDFIFSAAH